MLKAIESLFPGTQPGRMDDPEHKKHQQQLEAMLLGENNEEDVGAGGDEEGSLQGKKAPAAEGAEGCLIEACRGSTEALYTP
jgi:hypothetical protein